MRKTVACVPLVALFFLNVSYEQVERVQEASAGQPVNDIRQVDFKNFTYTRLGPNGESKVIHLRDGRQTSTEGAETTLMRITYGDLTNDRSEDAVVLLRGQNTRISRTLDEIFIYTLRDGKIAALDHFEAGRRGDYVLSVSSLESNFKIQDGLLILDQAILRAGEGAPTQYYTIKYRWNGIQMIEVDRSALKPLPHHMMEVG